MMIKKDRAFDTVIEKMVLCQQESDDKSTDGKLLGSGLPAFSGEILARISRTFLSPPYLLKGKVEQDFTAVPLTVHWIEFLDRSHQENHLLLRSKRTLAHA
jgi:hypothetical protein